MKLKRLMAASMAAVMAVSSAIVCEIPACAVQVLGTATTDAKYEGLNIFGQGNEMATVTKMVFNVTLGAGEGSNGELVFNIGQEGVDEIKKTYGVDDTHDVKLTPGVATDVTIEVDSSNTVNQWYYKLEARVYWGGDLTINYITAYAGDTVVSQIPDQSALFEGTKVPLKYNAYDGGYNYQGSYELTKPDGVTTAEDLFAKAAHVEVKFVVNGASCDGKEFDVSKIGFSIAPKIHNPTTNDWPWKTTGSATYDETTKTVTVSADITKDLFPGITAADYTFDDIILVPEVKSSDATAQVDMFIADEPEVNYTSDSTPVESVKITLSDGTAVGSSYTYGDTINLKATVLPEGAVGADKVEWASENPTVATVDENGKVTLLKAGEAKITATAGGVSNSVKFTVNKKKLTVAPSALTNIYVKDNEIEAAAKAVTAKYALENDENVSLVKGTDYTVSEPQISADKKYYSITITLSDDAAGKYELSTTTLKGYISYELASVALNSDTLNLVAGADGRQLAATTTPDNALLDNLTFTYKSSDETVATVDENGLVTPLKAGTATITVTAKAVVTINGGMPVLTKTATAKCTVTVTDIAIPATNIELDAFSKTMTVGDKAKLTATVKPADTTDKVVWTSSKPTVATVDENGNITALATGTTEITATAGSVSAVCKVTVEGVKVSEIKLDKTSVSLKAGETAQLTAVVTPDNAADKTVTWTSSDEKIATVADGKITAVAPGTATITATAGGKSATCTVTVAKEAKNIKDIRKYPDVPKDYAKVDPVVTTVNSDGTKNMLVMFSISDSDVKNFRGARITFKRADGKTFSRSLILGKYYTDVTYVKDGDNYNGNSQNYIVIRLKNVQDSWGDISAKFELINGLG